jgi:MFS family permease
MNDPSGGDPAGVVQQQPRSSFGQTDLITTWADLGHDTSTMNIAVAITALFSGIFIVVMGGFADRVGRVKIVRIGFYLSILGSLLVGFAPIGAIASSVPIVRSSPARAFRRLYHACQSGAGENLLGSEP